MNLENLKGLCKEIIKFYNEEQKNENILEEDIEKISNLRIQKLLFFIYGFYWKEKKQEIIPITFEAWEHWPVIKELYSFIINNLDKSNMKRNNEIDFNWFKDAKTPKYDKNLLNKILKYLSQFSTIRLVNASHKTEPWLFTENSNVINNEEIKKWFEKDVPAIK